MRLFIRTGTAAMGLGAVAVAVYLPMQLFLDQIRTRSQHPAYPMRWSSLVGTWLFAFMVSAFFASLAYLCLRHSFLPGRRTLSFWPDRLFKGLGVASASVIVAAILSQIVLLVFATIRSQRLPSNLRGAVSVGWSPSDWAAVRDSTAFLILASLLFVSMFFWHHRKASRALPR